MQGFNMGRYYPPDAENAPSFNQSSHPLGQRAKKINQGILTVRFELPFAVWCQHCKPEAIIGQGVRFNAEKKKVGKYYSTPIWSFRMKHTPCGGWWEIRTDPKNTEYIVVEGARRRDYGPEEKEARGELAFLTEEERERRRNDAFANLEGKVNQKSEEKRHTERLEELYEAAQIWEDPYTANQRLRRDFRAKRKVLEKEGKYKESMQEKFSLGLEIADEIESDQLRAKLINFDAEGLDGRNIDVASRKPLFDTKVGDKKIEPAPNFKKLKSEILAERSRNDLQQKLVGNTRAAINPFDANSTRTISKTNLGFLKRKRIEGREPESVAKSSRSDPLLRATSEAAQSPTQPPTSIKQSELPVVLVDYDSD